MTVTCCTYTTYTCSTLPTLSTSAAGAGIVPVSSNLPGAILAAPSLSSARIPTNPTLPSDALSDPDQFILDEIIRHVQATHPSPLPHTILSQPIIWDGTHYKRISPRTCSKTVRPFLRYVTVISGTLRRVLSSASRESTLSPQMTVHLSQRIIFGSTIRKRTRSHQHVSKIMSTNPATKFQPIQLTSLLLLSLQLSVIATRGVSDKAM